MTAAAEAVRLKIHLMDEQIRFLEWVWRQVPQVERDELINNYAGKVSTLR